MGCHARRGMLFVRACRLVLPPVPHLKGRAHATALQAICVPWYGVTSGGRRCACWLILLSFLVPALQAQIPLTTRCLCPNPNRCPRQVMSTRGAEDNSQLASAVFAVAVAVYAPRRLPCNACRREGCVARARNVPRHCRECIRGACGSQARLPACWGLECTARATLAHRVQSGTLVGSQNRR